MDPYLATGLGLGVFGALAAFACWAADLFNDPRFYEEHRRKYQAAIRHCIVAMVSDEAWDGEWALHSLLYEYRNGA